MLQATNIARSTPTDCGVYGTLPAVPPLVGDENLHLSEAIERMAAGSGPDAIEVDPADVLQPAAADPPAGSNSWALGLSRSGEGSPIVANDPHLGLGLPGVWYQIHLRSPGYEAAGISSLLQRTTIGRQSLYDTFGDKHSLFLETLNHYFRTRLGPMLAQLRAPGSPRKNLLERLEHFVHEILYRPGRPFR